MNTTSDFIVCDSMPRGMRLVRVQPFADASGKGHLLTNAMPDFDLTMDEDGEIHARRNR
jgi:hypothetical protein